MQRNLIRKGLTTLGVLVAAFFMVFFRLYALTSDAYPRLSWSSALLTDEGFYLHNARNILLFHTFQTDQFNNALIMPFLHYAQLATFHLLGFGLLQDRLLSVASSLLTLPFLFLATKRFANTQTAFLACLLWGLSHANFLYNRLALMDTPGALVLCVGWWLWGEAWAYTGKKRKGLLALCGVVLGLVYGVRGLGALVWVVPVGILGWEWWKKRQKSTLQELLWYLSGLGAFLVLYFFWWVRPHYQQLQHMDHYYVMVQLRPHSFRQLLQNIDESFFSWGRGLIPYLLKHVPIECLGALFWVSTWLRSGKIGEPDSLIFRLRPLWQASNKAFKASVLYLAGWIGIMWLFLSVVNYAPSRYYVLFYPALFVLGALGLMQMLSLKQGRFLLWGSLGLWLILNAYWTTDWLTHITYRQEAADRWLGKHLPANAVVFGAVAPGLCIENHLLPICMIAGLCNDHHPIEQYAGRPRYILILDNNGKDHRWREQWWVKHYPDLVDPKKQLHAFHHILRPFFTIGLYAVPNNWKGEPRNLNLTRK